MQVRPTPGRSGGGLRRGVGTGECSSSRSCRCTGLAKAQHNVAVALIDAIGTDRDVPAGVAYYERAAAQGFELSQVNLGKLYLEGGLVAADPERAAALFRAVVARQPAVRELLQVAETRARAAKPPEQKKDGGGCTMM